MKKIFLILFLPFLALAQTQTENYIKTTTYKGAGATLPVVQVSYFDGLGRPIQQVAHAQSGTGKDIVTHIEYDAFGRQVKEFLPYVNTAPSLNYNTSANIEVGTFYNNANYENTLNPFSQKEYEASPLNRVLKQAAPGNDWKLGSGHEIKIDYQTNTATEVKYHNVTTTWMVSKGLYDVNIAQTTNYDANQLYKTITKDENWTAGNNNTTEEFKNKEGQVVLKRTYNATIAHDTYYVYDMYGNLSYVIPPKAEGAIDTVTLNNLCYQYKYDYRNRLVEKKIPGKQWEFIVYDKLDRPVATGPAFSPFANATANTIGWLITKYDAFNRPVYTGWQQATINETERKNIQNDQNILTTTLNETKQTSGTINGITAYYSNDVAPTAFKLLTVNYYDNYTFPNAPTLPTTLPNSTYPIAQNVKGLSTGSWVRVLTTDTATTGEASYTFYDDKYRAVSSFVKNHLGGYTQVDSNLDFIGKTNYTVTKHKYNASSTELTVREDFVYSAQDRLLTHTNKINSMPEQLLAANFYDELGQTSFKMVGAEVGQMPLQRIDYTYNIRGWLKTINDVTNSMSTAQTGSNPDLFAFKLNYNNPTRATALFNGNISESFWKTNSDNVLRKYNYSYDDLNRLKDAIYEKPDTNTPITNSYNESLDYDKNGNIQWLKRNGEYDDTVYSLQIDDLVYSYDTANNNPNKLLKILDKTNNKKGFKDDASGISDPVDDFAYDDNGNMTRDDNKKITTITYNHLNLPVKITFFGTNKFIEYLYNATGQKLQKKVTEASVVNTTEYLGGYQYRNIVLEFFPHAEGYVKNTVDNSGNNNYNYVFNYTDHLGNIRMSYGWDVATNSVKVLEENNYYPFGLKHNNYNVTKVSYGKSGLGSIVLCNCPSGYTKKYNGKNFEEELGLNFYDYGARNYMADIGRWGSIDPLAEKGRRWSPYNYAMNNPTFFIDPDGMLSQSFIDDLIKKSGSGETKWTNNDNGSFSSNTGESADTGESTNEPPVNVFTFMKSDIFNAVFNEANKKGNYKEGDGIFSIFGHGGPGYINNHNDKWSGTNAQSAVEFDEMMVALSPAYGKFAKNLNDPFTCTIYSCQSATNQGTEYPSLAQQISTRHPNATIIGFDGFAIYGNENKMSAITKISTNIKEKGNVTISDNKGYIVTFRGGKEIKRELYTEYKNRIKK